MEIKIIPYCYYYIFICMLIVLSIINPSLSNNNVIYQNSDLDVTKIKNIIIDSRIAARYREDDYVSCSFNGYCTRKDNVALVIGSLYKTFKLSNETNINTNDTQIDSRNPFENAKNPSYLSKSKYYVCGDGFSECINSCCNKGFCTEASNYCDDLKSENLRKIHAGTLVSFFLLAVVYWVIFIFIGIKYQQKTTKIIFSHNNKTSSNKITNINRFNNEYQFNANSGKLNDENLENFDDPYNNVANDENNYNTMKNANSSFNRNKSLNKILDNFKANTNEGINPLEVNNNYDFSEKNNSNNNSNRNDKQIVYKNIKASVDSDSNADKNTQFYNSLKISNPNQYANSLKQSKIKEALIEDANNIDNKNHKSLFHNNTYSINTNDENDIDTNNNFRSKINNNLDEYNSNSKLMKIHNIKPKNINELNTFEKSIPQTENQNDENVEEKENNIIKKDSLNLFSNKNTSIKNTNNGDISNKNVKDPIEIENNEENEIQKQRSSNSIKDQDYNKESAPSLNNFDANKKNST